MRVGCLFDTPIVIGGGELSFLDLVAELKRAGVNVAGFVPGAGEISDRLSRMGVECIQVTLTPIRPRSVPRVIADTLSLRRAIGRSGIDILHANGARCMLYGGIAARLARIPCIWHVRVLDRDGILDRLRGALARLVITNSGAVAESVRSVAHPRCPLRVVYNGFALGRIESAPKENLRDTLGLGNGPVVLGVGRFSPWKRFDLLIKSFAAARVSLPGSSLVLAGRALSDEVAHETYLRDLASRLCPGAVHFIGWREEIHPVMKGADLFVLPSDNEPFGRVIVEAWACGLPVIVTGGGGAGEIVEDGRTGLTVPVGDHAALTAALVRMGRDASLRAQLAERGRLAMRAFTIEKHAKMIMAIYQDLCPSS